MSEYASITIRMYDGKIFGEKVSEYGLAKGWDYTLTDIKLEEMRK